MMPGDAWVECWDSDPRGWFCTVFPDNAVEQVGEEGKPLEEVGGGDFVEDGEGGRLAMVSAVLESAHYAPWSIGRTAGILLVS